MNLNRFFLVSLGVILISFISYNDVNGQVSYLRNGETECVEHDGRLVYLASNQVGNSYQQAVFFAEKNALENLLFKGIANCIQEKPMVTKFSDETDDFFYRFFDNADYVQFVVKSENLYRSKKKKVWTVKQLVQIDQTALRKYLIDKDIIKPFGIY